MSASSSRLAPMRSAAVTQLTLEVEVAPTMTFSSTVIVGNSARFWNVRATPAPAMPWAGTSSRLRPSKVIEPVVGS